VGHVGLDVLDAGGGGIFAGFGVIVEEVWRTGFETLACIEGSESAVGEDYRVSSGRDMVSSW
jgi:hypothetical protein